MYLLNMKEMILPQFPGVPPLQVHFDLNRAQEAFVRRTRVLGSRVRIDATTDKLSEDLTNGFTFFRLPNDFSEVVSIDELPRNRYIVENGQLKVFMFPGGLSEFWMRYMALPVPMVEDNEQPSFYSEFHPALVAKVLMQYYGLRGMVREAEFQMRVYADYVKEAVVYGNTMSYRTVSGVGDTVIIAKGEGITLVEGENIIPLGKTFATADSYAVVPNAGDILVSTVNPNTGLPEKTTTTFKVWAPAPTSSFEFIAVGS